uniref:Uncharacterized protein n=1 Tax=Oryza glumipatula TaxID=40148 RepID=A0A0E0BK13_9ORYZ
MGFISEVFAVLADMDYSVMEGRAWTHCGCLGCLFFLRDEETDTERMARIEAASDTSSAATPVAPTAAPWPPSPPPPRTPSAASTSSCRPTVAPAVPLPPGSQTSLHLSCCEDKKEGEK